MMPNKIPVFQQDFQNEDSTVILSQPSIDVPERIELKVERPSIQLLQEEEAPAPKRKVRAEQPITSAENESLEDAGPQMVYTGPDTLDAVLLTDWQASGFTGHLWFSESYNSICLVPSDYFQNEPGDGDLDMNVPKAHNNGEGAGPSPVADSSVIVQKALNKLETSEIQDPIPVNVHHRKEPLLGQNWFMVLIVVLVALTGVIRFKWHKYLSDVFSAVFFKNIAGKLQNGSGGSQAVASFGLEVLFYANFSLLFFESLRLSGRTFFDLSGWKLLLPLFGFLIVIFTLKFIVYRFVGWVFRVQEATSTYLFQSSVMSKAFGLVLMPLVVVFPFLEPEARHWIPSIGFSIFILLYVVQVGRGIVANLRGGLSGYYIFLYLCALEILPLSILIKVLFY
ncbi:DUF4271 domain-containing protein [Marinilabilia salmonicolor]|uniref:DUF4271 domain-containing protein n=1 Tax=Marinilabilia salmonicolor TaxID=989 RepID=UPI0012F62350|nr:DUF4271 domain-containing protein [Marinilabilia salmonicolor]